MTLRPILPLLRREAAKNTTPGAPAGSAAPAGGAFGCRGCAYGRPFGILQPLALTLLLAAPAAVAAQDGTQAEAEAQRLETPSGLAVAYLDRIDESPVWRYRYVAPALSGESVDFASVSEDMALLCSTHALPQLQHEAAQPERIIVTLMSEEADFGVMSPGVRQFFESYSIEGDLCIWEVF